MTARPEGDFDDVIAFAWDGPADSVADAARLLLLDSLGCMIAGLGHAAPRRGAGTTKARGREAGHNGNASRRKTSLS